jgi:hypothetical protein
MTPFFIHLVKRHSPAAGQNVRPRLPGRFETGGGVFPAGLRLDLTGRRELSHDTLNDDPNAAHHADPGQAAGQTSNDLPEYRNRLFADGQQAIRQELPPDRVDNHPNTVHYINPGQTIGGNRDDLPGYLNRLSVEEGKAIGIRRDEGFKDPGRGHGDTQGSGEDAEPSVFEPDTGWAGQQERRDLPDGSDKNLASHAAAAFSKRSTADYPTEGPLPRSLTLRGNEAESTINDGALRSWPDSDRGLFGALPESIDAMAIRALAERLSQIDRGEWGYAGQPWQRQVIPRQRAAGRMSAAPATEPAPTIRVTIGRIEVKAGSVNPVSENRRPVSRKKVLLSLEEFLKTKKDPT